MGILLKMLNEDNRIYTALYSGEPFHPSGTTVLLIKHLSLTASGPLFYKQK